VTGARRSSLPVRPLRRSALAACVLLAGCSSGGSPVTDEAAEPTTSAVEIGVTTTTRVVDGDPLSRDDITRLDFAPDSVAPDEAPLTGTGVADVNLLARPALAIKVDNVDSARPQTGLVEADLVYEELVEGGLTRLLAVYQSEDPPLVGPVRSARSTDVPLLMPLKTPMFVWSGANTAFSDMLDRRAVADVGVEARPDGYLRRDDRNPPSDLYALTEVLRGFTADVALPPPPQFSYLPRGGDDGTDGPPVVGVAVEFGSTSVVHRWDDSRRGWAREQNGTPHVDEDGVQVAPENVIVQFVTYLDTGLVDANGAAVPEAQIWEGQGTAWVLSGGRLTVGTWFKPNLTIETIFLDAEGDEIPVTRGRTWVLLAPEGAARVLD